MAAMLVLVNVLNIKLNIDVVSNGMIFIKCSRKYVSEKIRI